MDNYFRILGLVAFFVLILSSAVGQSRADISPIPMNDDSDWWSELNPSYKSIGGEWAKRVVPADNFRILGITPLGGRADNWLERKLGKSEAVARGDASTGRVQFCYTSVKPGKIYLISEAGEVELGFYLFADSPHWKGQEFCRPSPLVDRRLSTESGLRLDLTRAQVKAILGKPTRETANVLVYWFQVEIPTSPEGMRMFLNQNPSYSESEIVGDFPQHYTLSATFTARFTNNRLIYLSILRSEVD